ncbi:MAG: hypothetical protein GC162_00460 [Planctomycetes bacterium]|nr:hypothetical protein [Planctomycetota bacterium]
MRNGLRITGYLLLFIAAAALVALLVIVPMVGTPGGTHTLYVMRRPVAVTAGEFQLVMTLLAMVGVGSLGGMLCLMFAPRR